MYNHKSINSVAILAYHKIGEPPSDGWPTWSYVSEYVFTEHLRYLHENGWKVISLDTFLAGLIDPTTLPERAALITFDDGYRNNLDIALPCLQRFSFPAVIFVPAAFVGGYNAFDADIFYEPKEPICTWKELRSLETHSISVQSHGFLHRHLSKLSVEEQRVEIIQSKAILEDKLGKRIDAFSFAYGDDGLNNVQIENMLAEASYAAAFLYKGGPVDVSVAQPYKLSRVPVGPDTDLHLVLGKISVNDSVTKN